MKVKVPDEFNPFYDRYKETANYFVALSDSGDAQHALWLCMRDSFIAGMVKKDPTPPTEEKDE